MKLIFWGGMGLFVGSLILLAANYKNIEVEKRGILVTMKVVKVPASCTGTKVKRFVRLRYNGKVYIKMIKVIPCERFRVGQFIQMRYLEGYSTILFPKESVVENLVSFGVLSLLGLGIALSQLKKIR